MITGFIIAFKGFEYFGTTLSALTFDFIPAVYWNGFLNILGTVNYILPLYALKPLFDIIFVILCVRIASSVLHLILEIV